MNQKTRTMLKLGAVVVLLLCFALTVKQQMETGAEQSAQSAHAQVYLKLHDTIKLVESYSEQEWMIPDKVDYRTKATMLLQDNEVWEFFGIFVLDKDIGTYNPTMDASSSSLASREYLQELWATNKTQITDIFRAGKDGATLNYTIAAAIKDDAKKNGALFAAIFEKDISEMVKSQPYETFMTGKLQQSMSGVADENIGQTLDVYFEGYQFLSTSLEDELLQIKNHEDGAFWALHKGTPTYCSYKNVGLDSGWTIVSKVALGDVLSDLSYVSVGILLTVVVLVVDLVCARTPKEQKTKPEAKKA